MPLLLVLLDGVVPRADARQERLAAGQAHELVAAHLDRVLHEEEGEVVDPDHQARLLRDGVHGVRLVGNGAEHGDEGRRARRDEERAEERDRGRPREEGPATPRAEERQEVADADLEVHEHQQLLVLQVVEVARLVLVVRRHLAVEQEGPRRVEAVGALQAEPQQQERRSQRHAAQDDGHEPQLRQVPVLRRLRRDDVVPRDRQHAAII
mmetsp:Transcript_22216/g.62511  ORF Transcript_22216/g.62511 Transcript_22216/m.62511 type:complete len:209 (-) Transcript_22216:2329-2955(-)